jgi:hypothetical protein
MTEPGLEETKDGIIGTITEAYARGDMDMPSFERAVTRIHASGDRRALAVEAAALGLALPEPAPEPRAGREIAALGAVELSCVSGSLRQEGDWVKSRRYVLSLKSSSARLDLREYEAARGFRLTIDIDARSSVVRITVPKGFEVEDRFSERVSSTVRNRRRGGAFGDNLVVLTGAIRSSVVKIKYR